MFGSLKPPVSLGRGYSKTNNGLRYLIPHALNTSNRLATFDSRSTIRQPRGCHLCSCFQGQPCVHTRACVIGPCLPAGCARAAWVSGGSQGNDMGAGGRCLAPRVVSVSWSRKMETPRLAVRIGRSARGQANHEDTHMMGWLRDDLFRARTNHYSIP